MRAGAGAPGAAVDPALVGGAALARAEREVGGGRARRVRGVGVDRRLRGGQVDGERSGRGSLDVAGDVGRARAHGVAAVGGEASGGEGQRPVAAREGRRVPHLGGAREVGAVPVVARALLDRDSDPLDAGAAVRLRSAEAARRAARVPGRRAVGRRRDREARRRARVRVVDPPVREERGVGDVAGAVLADRAEVVEAVGHRGRIERDRVGSRRVHGADVRPGAGAREGALEPDADDARVGVGRVGRDRDHARDRRARRGHRHARADLVDLERGLVRDPRAARDRRGRVEGRAGERHRPRVARERGFVRRRAR